jgi:hypothetical protein
MTSVCLHGGKRKMKQKASKPGRFAPTAKQYPHAGMQPRYLILASLATALLILAATGIYFSTL